MQSIKQQILTELKKPNFPDLHLIYSPEALDLAPEILEELLEEEKKDFEEKLLIKDEEIRFETFQDFSLLDYYFSLLEHYQGVHNDETIRKIIEDFEPKYIDFWNEVAYNHRLYEMYKYCFDYSQLDSQQKRILEKTLKAYEVRGISLPETEQNRLKEISKELSELSQKFSNNILDDKKLFEYIITDENVISQMPEDDKLSAKKRAEENGKTGFLFDASHSAYSAIMKYCSDGDIRRHFYEARIQFASQGKYDNREIILKILKLREEKSRILGYKNYAELSLEFKMAESPEQVIELFGDIAEKARPKAVSELEEIKLHFSLPELEPWDSSYYSRKLREEKYELDERELKKYFVFENVLRGLFEIVGRLYGIEMKSVSGKLYDSDIQLYEVYKNGTFLSYFFTDYFYNPLKRQGAWANILRAKEFGNTKIVVNVCNFQKSSEKATLLTLEEVETMFHEFGHAIHEMLSYSEHSELSGFAVEWDFVELPSQLLENWCRDPEGMELFARHYESGKKIPKEMLEKLKTLETFGNGHFVLKQNEYAMLDMTLHSKKVPENIGQLQDISDALYLKNSLYPLSENYKAYASFSHIFDGWYAAGYYSYMWAEIIEKEVWKAFKDSGNIFSPELAYKFYTDILWAGSTKKASELFRDFFGRDPETWAFLQEKGLV